MLTPKNSAIRGNVCVSGCEVFVSHLETACGEILRAIANCSCVIPLFFLKSVICFEILISFITLNPFKYSPCAPRSYLNYTGIINNNQQLVQIASQPSVVLFNKNHHRLYHTMEFDDVQATIKLIFIRKALLQKTDTSFWKNPF